MVLVPKVIACVRNVHAYVCIGSLAMVLVPKVIACVRSVNVYVFIGSLTMVLVSKVIACVRNVHVFMCLFLRMHISLFVVAFLTMGSFPS